ncbi:MAG TPA: ABC transporter substrate-binding protein [Thermomicrobiales bacterium]|nr:ABC transporter substrate-binding protein [Thermomicrobiales bacterium]
MGEERAFAELLREARTGRLSRREVLRRAIAIGLGAPTIAALLAACGGYGAGAGTPTSAGGAGPAAAGTAATPASSSGVKGGSLKVAIIGEPPTLDMHWGTPTIIGFVTWNIYEPLFAFDDKFQVIPMLAESHDVSADGLTHTLKIRKQVPFHNGEELKAADVLASLKRWAGKQGLGAALFKATDKVTPTDDHTLEFTMKQPYGTFESSLAYFYQGAAIYPKSVIDAAGDQQIKQFIGTGPYKFVEHQPDRFIRLARFDGYAALPGAPKGYGGHKHAYVDEMVFTPVGDEAARIAGLRAGNYHYLESISADQYSTLKDDPNVDAIVMPPGGWDTFVINWKSPLMKNQQIRQAFQAALNSGPILDAGWGQGFYRLEASVMQKETAWYTEAGKELYNQHNPDKARQLLKDAGYDGTPVRFMTTKQYLEQYNNAVVGKQQLEAAGFKIDLQVYDWATLTTRRTKPDLWDVFTTGISFRPDPTQLAIMQLCNWPGWWCSDASEGILAKLQSESDFGARFKLWEQLQTNFYEEVPMIKLGDTKSVTASAKALKGLSTQTQLGPILWNTWLAK